MSEQFKSLRAALAKKDLIGFKHRTVGGAPAVERASTASGKPTKPTQSRVDSGAAATPKKD